jgi:hypothetical protein
MAFGLLLPDTWGRALFGPTWDDAEALVIPMGLMLVAATLFSGALLGLRALGDARRSFSCRMKTAPCHVAFSLIGAALGGAVGYALGLALAEANAAVVWWTAFIRTLREMERDKERRESDDGAEADDVPALVGAVERAS